MAHRPRIRRREVLAAGAAATGLGVAGLGMADGAPATHTLLTQNAWLLDEPWAGVSPVHPDAADGDWIPREQQLKPVEKPALEARAQELGARFSYSDLDIIALQEVFDAEQRQQIRDPIQRSLADAVGPRQRPEEVTVSSGLYTLALDLPIVASERMAFEHSGNRRRDADAYARKGVLFTRIDLGDGAIDLFTTHLLAGGGWPTEAIDPSPVREPVGEAEYRRRQLDEFATFVESVKATYDTERTVPIVCAGDFNIAPGDPEADALDTFRDRLGLVDAWTETHPRRPGPTDTDAITTACRFDPYDSPPAYCDGGRADNADRIDYVFVEDRADLQVRDIKRRVFWRELAPPDQFFVDAEETVPNYLADHVGLEVEFAVR